MALAHSDWKIPCHDEEYKWVCILAFFPGVPRTPQGPPKKLAGCSPRVGVEHNSDTLLLTHSTAVKGVAGRRGCGKIRHLEVHAVVTGSHKAQHASQMCRQCKSSGFDDETLIWIRSR
eukprot:4224445-Amphidinium_carterae.1